MSGLPSDVCRDPEVSQQRCPFLVDQNILGLDVLMYNSERVDHLQAVLQLLLNLCRSLTSECGAAQWRPLFHEELDTVGIAQQIELVVWRSNRIPNSQNGAYFCERVLDDYALNFEVSACNFPAFPFLEFSQCMPFRAERKPLAYDLSAVN